MPEESGTAVGSAVVKFVPPKPPSPRPRPTPNAMKLTKADFADTDRFIIWAREIAANNWNKSRNPERSPSVKPTEMFLTAFAMTLSSWKVTLGSPVIKGTIWIVTYNATKSHVYIDTYRMTDHQKIEDIGVIP